MQPSRTPRFMTPKSAMECGFRDAARALAPDHAFARRLFNSGRLSQPCSLTGMRLQTPDAVPAVPGPAPGTACPDAPVGNGGSDWLLNRDRKRTRLKASH